MVESFVMPLQIMAVRIAAEEAVTGLYIQHSGSRTILR